MNVLEVLAITSTSFVLFAVLWVMVLEDYLESREAAPEDENGENA
jgi:hypothetical protein